MTWRASQPDIDAIIGARHADSFAVLGLHQFAEGAVIRAFVPGATTLHLDDGTEFARRHDDGFFELLLPGRSGRFAYSLHAANDTAWILDDPYRFGPVLGPTDDHLLAEGTHRQLYEKLGAHPMRHEGVDGVHFAVWAPNAARVSVVGDFNAWDGRRHQMRKRVDSGVWEIFAPGIGEGTVYKFEILGPGRALLPLKADPFGFAAERRPSTASVVARTDNFAWTDGDWLARRTAPYAAPIAIYEVHLPSWQREHGRMLTYDELADRLIPYAAWLGFTHLQLLPITEHPLDDSWGYQPVGLFAPTSRHGAPAAFARFVDRAHAAGIGVILDWVPAHFPVDAHGLANFDGTALYEHADPRQGFHPDWNTAIYNFGRREVANILTASALYWLDRFHIDGLRVDAVASMLYLDYSRRPGEWVPNDRGGRENTEAVAFLRHVNTLAYAAHPGVLMVAEESTAWPGVTAPADAGGLGFGFKWNMGWMHDTLEYLALDPVYRRWHHDRLTFGLVYAFAENFILPLSHDEVVHGKRSLLGRIAGDDWQKRATLRAFYGFMWGHPGKKLLFMGQEFGQPGEWNFAGQLDWGLMDTPGHRGIALCVRDLNALYRAQPALAADGEAGFRWIVVDDSAQSVLAWLRSAPGAADVAVICNFTPVPRPAYRIGLPQAGRWREALNSNAEPYGGGGMGNFGAVTAEAVPSHGFPASAVLVIPPLATIYLVFETG
jgi:1,4-alpha-glucan branching enzyme